MRTCTSNTLKTLPQNPNMEHTVNIAECFWSYQQRMVVYIRQLNYSKFSSENTVLYIVGPYRTFVSTTFYSNRIVMKSRKSFICILQSIANEKSHLKARTYSILSIKKGGVLCILSHGQLVCLLVNYNLLTVCVYVV